MVAGKRIYRAERVAPMRWELTVGEEQHASYRSYRAAAQGARAVERWFRTKRVLIRSAAIVAVSAIAIGVMVEFRHVTNPHHQPAAEFAANLEMAYRSVEEGSLELASLPAGLQGDEFLLEVGTEGEQSVRVIVGEFLGDCYLIRWRSSGAPFVATLSSRFPCVPGPATLSSSVDAYQAIAVQLSPDRPIDWEPVLPSPTNLARWFFPAVFVVGFILLRTLVSLSILAIQKGVPTPPVSVDRVDPGYGLQSESTNG